MEANGKITEIIANSNSALRKRFWIDNKGLDAEKKMSCNPSPLLKYLMNKEE
jgi:hypothetical protein